jgi:para-nitrobenzyl esterase
MNPIDLTGITALLSAAALGGAALAQTTPVQIDGGLVSGVAQGPALVYLGIPYAAPPVGPLRWKPPHAPAPWTGVRAAISPGPACPQPLTPGRPNLGGYDGPTSEDCLTLNVTAPKGATKAPVMVWIYGGGDIAGSKDLPSTDGRNFARDGVILVAMNYRLGALGFFAHPALTAEAAKGAPLANYGLMDQAAALRWVRKNIAAFGGDPDNVTLFGESAGGEDALALMTIPTARGLFQKVIVQSGTDARSNPLAKAEDGGLGVAQRAGLSGPSVTADALRALSADALVKAGLGEGVGGLTVDGGLMEEPVADAFRRGDEAKVPLMIGWDSNEASLMRLFTTPAGWILHLAPAVRAAYGDEDEANLVRESFNDAVMAAPARWFAQRQAAWRAPAWLYYFDYVPERQRAERPGTNHASEIPFVFDSIDAIPGRGALASPSERALTALTHACWVAFAKTGAPACGGGWARVSVQHAPVFLLSEHPKLEADFRKAQLDAQQADNPAFATAGTPPS